MRRTRTSSVHSTLTCDCCRPISSAQRKTARRIFAPRAWPSGLLIGLVLYRIRIRWIWILLVRILRIRIWRIWTRDLLALPGTEVDRHRPARLHVDFAFLFDFLAVFHPVRLDGVI